MLPIVNHARLARIEVPQKPATEMSLNNVCIVVIILAALGIYKRYRDISHKRAQLNALSL